MEIAYTNYTNVDARFGRPDERGDRLVRGYSGTIDIHGGEPLVEEIAEQLFDRHNRDDRPDGRLCPSMSVGDVVVVAEVAVSVDACGWRRVDLDPADMITDRSWRAVIDEPHAAVPAGAARDIVSGWAASAATPPSTGLGFDGIGP
jgi:hypothetical protein